LHEEISAEKPAIKKMWSWQELPQGPEFLNEIKASGDSWNVERASRRHVPDISSSMVRRIRMSRLSIVRRSRGGPRKRDIP
jgi:hypothetical protein